MKAKIIGAVLLSVCMIAGCAFNPMLAVYDDDKAIAGKSNTYNLNNYKAVSGKGRFTASAEKMEGMDTIWTFDAEEDKALDMTYMLKVFSGKLKLVLISPEGEVTVIEECDTEMTEPAQSTLNVEKGENRIKIVAGENTKFDVDISIAEGEFG